MLLHLVDVYHGHCWTPTHLRLPISREALVYVHVIVYHTLHLIHATFFTSVQMWLLWTLDWLAGGW